MSEAIPKGLRGMYPPVVLCEQIAMHRDPARKAWLVVQHCPEQVTQFHKEGAQTVGRALVCWYPRASYWNCRPHCLGNFYGSDALDSALAVAATAELRGPEPGETCRPASASFGERDTQRKRVYRWEDTRLEIRNNTVEPVMTQPEAQAFIDRVCRVIGERRPVPVKKHNGVHGANADGEGITSNATSLRPTILLHELAHTLIHRLSGGRKLAGHGAEWLAVYIALVCIFRRPGQYSVLCASARLAGLTVGDIADRTAWPLAALLEEAAGRGKRKAARPAPTA